jgi:hypothetical protein
VTWYKRPSSHAPASPSASCLFLREACFHVLKFIYSYQITSTFGEKGTVSSREGKFSEISEVARVTSFFSFSTYPFHFVPFSCTPSDIRGFSPSPAVFSPVYRKTFPILYFLQFIQQRSTNSVCPRKDPKRQTSKQAACWSSGDQNNVSRVGLVC